MTDFQWRLQGRCYKLGHNVPHPGGVVPNRIIIGRHFDANDIIPHLFEETDPGFHERCQPGDIIVAGRNFGMGPKMNGYIAMQALGLGLVCESMPFLGYRAAVGCGLRVLTDCVNVLEFCETGDELEVDFRDGYFVNRTRDIRREYPPIPDGLLELVELGGNTGWLREWWSSPVGPVGQGRHDVVTVARLALVLAALAGAASAAEDGQQCGAITGNPQLAIQVCTRAIEFMSLERPELARAYYSRGTEWANQGNFDRAIPDLNMSIELEPKRASAYYNRALAWSAKGESDRAISDYDAALKLSPRDVSAYVGRGAEWIAQGEYKRAFDDYERALQINADSAAAWFGRGRARLYAGDFMMSASDLYRAHDLEPSIYSALWLYLARKRADIPGERTLAREAGTSGSGVWPAPVVALYLGSSNPDAVLRAAMNPEPTRQRDLKCEASFYVAQWHILRGAQDAAQPLLKDVVATCPRSFIEREGAVAELRRPR